MMKELEQNCAENVAVLLKSYNTLRDGARS